MSWLTSSALRLTGRTIRWASLGVACGGAFAMLAALRLGSQAPPSAAATALILAAVVGGAAAALTEPSVEMLRALPVSHGLRSAVRLAVVALPTTAVAVGLGLVGHAWYPRWDGPGAVAVAALMISGSAGGVVLGRLRPNPAEAAGSLLIGWVVAASVALQFGAAPGLAMPWWHHPVATIGVAVAVIGLAGRLPTRS